MARTRDPGAYRSSASSSDPSPSPTKPITRGTGAPLSARRSHCHACSTGPAWSTISAAGGSAFAMGGLNYGGVAYLRPSDSWGLFGRLNGTSALGSTAGNAMGMFLGQGTVGAEWYWTPSIGLVLEGGYGGWPTSSQVPGSPLTLGSSWGPTGNLGLTFKF